MPKIRKLLRKSITRESDSRVYIFAIVCRVFVSRILKIKPYENLVECCRANKLSTWRCLLLLGMQEYRKRNTAKKC